MLALESLLVVLDALRALELGIGHRHTRDADAAPERRSVPARVRLAELGLVERADPEQELELVAQVRPHHLRAVGRDRERHVVLDERPDGVAHGVLVRQRLREEVRRRADLERDPEVADRAHQLGVAGGEDPVADPVRTQALDDLARSPRAPSRRPPRRRGSSRRARRRGPSRRSTRSACSRSGAPPGRGPAMSTPTTPRPAQRIAFSTMISFSRRSKVRSIIRISPARTCGYSMLARSTPRIAARMMWSRSRSPPRFRFIGLKRSSSVVIRCERYAPPIAPWTERSTASGEDWMSSVQW